MTTQACGPETAHLFDAPNAKLDGWREQLDQAFPICGRCEVSTRCLDWGISMSESGVYGGVLLHEGQRVRIADIVEHEPYDGDKARAGHNAYQRGERTPEAVAGNRAYYRHRDAQRKAKREAEAEAAEAAA